MKSITKISVILLFLFISNNLVAQNENAIKNAKETVIKINELIVSEDPKLELTEIQKSQVEKLILERTLLIKDLRKTVQDESKFIEQRQPIFDKYYQKIFVETLSKEQRFAHRDANKKLKEK